MGATRFELPVWESLELLGRETVGRLCVIEYGYPLAFPINYKTMRKGDETRIVFRTSPRAAIARYVGPASLEVDRIDKERQTAWSVMVRGTLSRVVGQHELPDTSPLVTEDRQQWVVLDVTAISGRRFTSKSAADGFSVEWQPSDA